MDILSFFEARESAENARAGSRFTDRSDYKDVFWKNLDAVCLNPGKKRVLHFYGFGGVGKTALCQELKAYTNEPSRREDREFCRIRLSDDWFAKRKIRAVYFSFEGQTDAPEVLKTLSALLFDEYQIPFRYFWFAYYRFMKIKFREEPEPLFESKRLDESMASEFLTGFTELFADFIPFGNFIKLGVNLSVKAAGAIGAGVGRASEKADPKLSEIQSMDEEKLKDMLPAYFALDFALFREKEKKKQGYADPVVIILDTFEQLTNALYEAQSAKVDDSWLWETRGQPGIIPCMPDCLWIIAGQRKIEWGKRDPEHWRDAAELPPEKAEDALIESHLLGSLAKEDAEEFLIKSDVAEPAIREAIYTHTEGIPIWLDFYVDVYRSIEGEKDVEEFRLDEKKLADRFIGNMRGVKRDMLECMVLLKRWSRQEEDKMRTAGLIQSLDTFSWLLELSFFNDNGTHIRIHDKIHEVLAHAANRGNREVVRRYVSESAKDKTLSSQDRVFRILQKITFDIEDLEAADTEELPGKLADFLTDNGESLRYLVTECTDATAELQRIRTLLDSRGVSCTGNLLLGMYLFCINVNLGLANKAAEYLDDAKDYLESASFEKMQTTDKLLFYSKMASYGKLIGNKGSMLIYQSRAYALSEGSATLEQMIHAAAIIADTYDKAGNVSVSQDYIDDALRRDKDRVEPVSDSYLADIAWIHILRAKHAINREDYPETARCLECAKKELDATGEWVRDVGNAWAYYYDMIGRYKKENGDDAGAEESYIRSLEASKQTLSRTNYHVYRENVCHSHAKLADFYRRRGRYGEAKAHLDEEISILKEMFDASPSPKLLGRLLDAWTDLIVLKEGEEQIPLLEDLLSKSLDEKTFGVRADFPDLVLLRQMLFYRYLGTGNFETADTQIKEIDRLLDEVRDSWYMGPEDAPLYVENLNGYLRLQNERRAKRAVEYKKYLYKRIVACNLRYRYLNELKDRADTKDVLKNLMRLEMLSRRSYEYDRSVDAVEQLCKAVNSLSLYYQRRGMNEAALPWAEEDYRYSTEVFERHPSRENYRSLWISLNMLIDVEGELMHWERTRELLLEKIDLIERMWVRDAQPEDLERLEGVLYSIDQFSKKSGRELLALSWFEEKLDVYEHREGFLIPQLERMDEAQKKECEEKYDSLLRMLTKSVIHEAMREGADDMTLSVCFSRWVDSFGIPESEDWDLYLDRTIRHSQEIDPALGEKLRKEMTEAGQSGNGET